MTTTMSNRDDDNQVLVILTLKRHEHGIWILQLVQSLEEIIIATAADNHETTTTRTTIRVVALEDWMSQGLQVSLPPSSSSSSIFSDNVIGIINRVSDAAPPPLFKACCALLTTAVRLYHIPVMNGPEGYALCANKWCQHVLFAQAGLAAPNTTAHWNTKEHPGQYNNNNNNGNNKPIVMKDDNRNTTTSEIVVDSEEGGTSSPSLDEKLLLVKPNAGGFGAGITKVSATELWCERPSSSTATTTTSTKITTTATSSPLKDYIFEDGVTLVQDYIISFSNKIYRVWFLNGKVQCAVEREINNKKDDNSSEFTSGCAAGSSCSRSSSRPPVLTAWKVPEDVRVDIEERLLPLLTDVHCGSVEFLIQDDSMRRLYFDLNLLSTLPLVVEGAEAVWGSNDYDPWKELALGLWTTIQMIQQEKHKR